MPFSPSLTEIKVRGFHVDAFGVVNHAWYVHFFEEARWAYFDERPAIRDALHVAGIAHSVVSLAVKYAFPVRLGDVLRIETEVSRASHHSITFEQRVYIGTGSDVATEAHVTNVFFLSRGGKTVGVDHKVFDTWAELRDLTGSAVEDLKRL